MPNSEYFSAFELDLPSALLEQLVAVFENMEGGPLEEAVIEANVPEKQGVYQLLLDDELIYIGKTVARTGLRKRLTRHSRKIQSRINLDPSNVTFKAVQILVFTTMEIEAWLTKYYKNQDADLSWIGSGFGSNDPGKRRDTTGLKNRNFDMRYPIDLDAEVSILSDTSVLAVSEVLKQIKEQLPYLLRYQKRVGSSRSPHTDLEEASMEIVNPTDTTENLLLQVKAALGSDWQITVLPGYIFIKKESEHYADSRVL